MNERVTEDAVTANSRVKPPPRSNVEMHKFAVQV